MTITSGSVYLHNHFESKLNDIFAKDLACTFKNFIKDKKIIGQWQAGNWSRLKRKKDKTMKYDVSSLIPLFKISMKDIKGKIEE